MHDISFLFLLFISYSFIGWLFETSVCSIRAKRFVDRGFLLGPLCPIYGFSALIFIYLLEDYAYDPLILFVLSTVIASIMEYITSYILEKLFKVRWWDYSHLPFNINGRVVLAYSTTFGLMGLLLVYIVNPGYESFILSLNNSIYTVALVIAIILAADLYITGKILFSIRRNVKIMLKDQTEEINLAVMKYLTEQVRLTKRLIKAFPNLKPSTIYKKNS